MREALIRKSDSATAASSPKLLLTWPKSAAANDPPVEASTRPFSARRSALETAGEAFGTQAGGGATGDCSNTVRTSVFVTGRCLGGGPGDPGGKRVGAGVDGGGTDFAFRARPWLDAEVPCFDFGTAVADFDRLCFDS